MHDDVSTTRGYMTKHIGNGVIGSDWIVGTNTCVTAGHALWVDRVVCMQILTKVSAELSLPLNGQQQDPPRNVVVSGDVQMRQVQKEFVQAPILDHSTEGGASRDRGQV